MKLPDLHVHSTHSDGDLTVAEIARAAERDGIIVAMADHLSPYHMLFDDDAFDAYEKDVRDQGLLLSGEYCVGQAIPVGRKRLKRLDFLIGGLHAARDGTGEKVFFWSERDVKEFSEFMRNYFTVIEETFEKEPIDILAHPTYLPLRLMKHYKEIWNRDRIRRLAGLAVEHNVALEISGRWKVPMPYALEIFLDAGATFSTGSDAHHEDNLFDLDYPYKVIEKLGITEDRLFLPVKQNERK
jgi:histidinol phosphatase-like PHP family hydrolase